MVAPQPGAARRQSAQRLRLGSYLATRATTRKASTERRNTVIDPRTAGSDLVLGSAPSSADYRPLADDQSSSGRNADVAIKVGSSLVSESPAPDSPPIRREESSR